VIGYAPAPAALDGAHPPAALATTVLVVDGMHCGNCLRKVEATLSALPDVASARVNLSAHRVSIVTRGTPPTAEPFVAALARIGFKASPLIEQGRADHDASITDYLKRLAVAGFAAANIMLLSVAVWAGYASDMPASLQTLFHWLSALIALPAIAYAGKPFFVSARRALAARQLNMDVPISLGVCLATAMSLYQTMRGTEQVYFDAAITLLFFLLVGRTLDHNMRARAASAAENLLGRRASVASVVSPDGRIERLAVAAVRPGMRVSVAAGEQFPVDGRLLSPAASIDESIITGESLPRDARQSDQVYAGTVALSGPLEIEVTAVAENSLLSDVARLMQTAEQARGRYVRLADRAARFYAPAVHVLGLATFLGWLALGYGWEPGLTAAIAVLIITCPCALALAVPTVQVVATSRLFRNGIVVKSADALERFAEVDTAVLDKTGTLTLGRAELADGRALEPAMLALAAGVALRSQHPYAQAVVRAAQRQGIDPAAVDAVREVAGGGLDATHQGLRVRLGSAAFCEVQQPAGQAPSLWLRRSDDAAIPLPIVDAIRPDAGMVIDRLRRDGMAVEILSGDTPTAVGEVARTLAIDTWRGAQRPEQKIERLQVLADSGRSVLMVGDGLNDAPALAAGHASLSPSSAADISQMSADAVFQGEKLGAILTVLQVAKAARRRAIENFAIAIGYNLIFVPLAMMGLVTPLIAAIAMSGSSIAVTANALRLRAGTTREMVR
jgi:Cu2+-exporting ATPase